MSISNAQDLLAQLISGCRRIENAWVTSQDQKRIAYAERAFWTQPDAPLDSLFRLLPMETSKESAMAIDWVDLLAKVESGVKFIEEILALLKQLPPVALAAAGRCNHHALCLATLEAQLKATQLCLCHYQACCEECAEDEGCSK